MSSRSTSTIPIPACSLKFQSPFSIVFVKYCWILDQTTIIQKTLNHKLNKYTSYQKQKDLSNVQTTTIFYRNESHPDDIFVWHLRTSDLLKLMKGQLHHLFINISLTFLPKICIQCNTLKVQKNHTICIKSLDALAMETCRSVNYPTLELM